MASNPALALTAATSTCPISSIGGTSNRRTTLFSRGCRDSSVFLSSKKCLIAGNTRSGVRHGRKKWTVKASARATMSTSTMVAEYQTQINYDYKGKSYYPMPVIDLNGLVDSDPAIRADLIKRVADAGKLTGVFCVVNHGIPTEVLDGFLRTAKEFFHLPLEEKLKSDRIKEAGYHRPVGYNRQFMDLTTKEFIVQRREVFEIQGMPAIQRELTPWPKAVPELRHYMEAYSDGLGRLSVWMLEVLAEGLDLPRNAFSSQMKEFHQQVIAAHYPPSNLQTRFNVNPNRVGFGAHTDLGLYNIVTQDEVGGVQVFLDGQWFDTPPLLEGIIFFIGDPMECMSNGAYQSTVHRVIAPETCHRFSSITTFEPLDKDNADYFPVPELGLAKYKTYNYGHRMSSIMGTRFDPDIMTKNFMLVDIASVDESRNFSYRDGAFRLGGDPLPPLGEGL